MNRRKGVLSLVMVWRENHISRSNGGFVTSVLNMQADLLMRRL